MEIVNIELTHYIKLILSVIIIGCIPILWEFGRGIRYNYDISLTGWYILFFVLVVGIPLSILLIFILVYI